MQICVSWSAIQLYLEIDRFAARAVRRDQRAVALALQLYSTCYVFLPSEIGATLGNAGPRRYF